MGLLLVRPKIARFTNQNIPNQEPLLTGLGFIYSRHQRTKTSPLVGLSAILYPGKSFGCGRRRLICSHAEALPTCGKFYLISCSIALCCIGSVFLTCIFFFFILGKEKGRKCCKIHDKITGRQVPSTQLISFQVSSLSYFSLSISEYLV